MASFGGFDNSDPGPLSRTISLPQPRPAAPVRLNRTRSALVGANTPGGWRSRNSAVHKPHVGFDVPLALPDDQLRELQCAACGELVQKPVYAPCGHSFCEKHLETKEDDNEVDQMAAILRRLCVDLGFMEWRARQTLAVCAKDPAKAEEMCRQASTIEGRAVRVRANIAEPTFQWGSVTPDSVGRVTRADDGHAHVDFAQQSRWHCLVSEIEIDEVADKIKRGALVRVKQGSTPSLGWGVLESDDVGEVVFVTGARVIVQGNSNLWYGYVGELELAESADTAVSKDPAGSETPSGPAPELPGYIPEEATTPDAFPGLASAVKRLRTVSPSVLCLASLGAIFRQIVDTADAQATRIMLRGERRKATMTTQGCMDLLRLLGVVVLKWDAYRSRTLIETADAGRGAKAKKALEALEAEFGAIPPLSTEDNIRYSVMMTVSKAARKTPYEEYWTETLQPKLTKALSPPNSRWTWPRKGWESEEELKKHVEDNMIKGKVAVSRGQTIREAKQIASSLEAEGLEMSIVQDGVVEGEDAALGEDPLEITPLRTWEGDFKRGARVRVVNVPSGHALAQIPAEQIGIIGSQFMSSQDGLTYVVVFPKVNCQHIPAKYLEESADAELIQPGVRVKVKAGLEPMLGWQGVESSDVGVVHAVLFDGVVHVYIPDLKHLFVAALHELDTKELPNVARGHCPICREPLLRGEHLATDLAVEAQLRRLRQLMAGERSERNDALGATAGNAKRVQLQAKAKPRAELMRTVSHKGELTCSICLDLMVSPVTLSCGHSFCKAHIEAWLLQHHSCPNCKHRVLQERLHKRCAQAPRAALFDTELRDDEHREDDPEENLAAPREGQMEGWPEIPVNRMLESQLVRYFPEELEERRGELASEVWQSLQARARGYLPRLKAFLRGSDAGAIQQLVAQGLDDMETKLPGTHGGTLLMLAAEQGLVAPVKNLLERGADPFVVANSSQDVGATALSLAAAQGHDAVLKVLVDATEWPVVRLADALAAAVEQRHEKCIEFFLARDEALVEQCNSFGFPALLTAVQTKSTQVIPLLIKHGAQLDCTLKSGILVSGAGLAAVNGVYQPVGEFEGKPFYQNGNGAVIFFKEWWKISDRRTGMGRGWYYSMPEPRVASPEPTMGKWTMYGYDNSDVNVLPPPTLEKLGGGNMLTPTVLAVQLGFVEAATQLLEARADPCSQLASTGETVLHMACCGGDLGMTRALLAAGASFTAEDRHGRKPLHAACSAGHNLVAAELLRASAPPDSEQAPTPLMLACCCGSYPPGSAKNPKTSVAGKYALLIEELLTAGADVSRCAPGGATMLHLAACAGASEKALNLLLEAKAKVDARDAEGRTPLLSALLAGRTRVVSLLVERAAPEDPVLGASYKGTTPFSAAVLLGDMTLVQSLLGKLKQRSGHLSWLNSTNSDVGPTQALLRLTSASLDQNWWHLVQEPNASTAEASECGAFEVGDKVMLVQDPSKLGYAAMGPLKQLDVGEIVKRDTGTAPFEVKLGTRSFWYRAEALRKYKVLAVEPSSWRGQFIHPYVNGGRPVNVHLHLDSATTGRWQAPVEVESVECERDGTGVKLRSSQSKIELDGTMQDNGVIRGEVVLFHQYFSFNTPHVLTTQAADSHIRHRGGSFLLVPTDQDATVWCPAGHATQRLGPASCRPATCDVCQRSVAGDPLFFACTECNYDVCRSCCGAPLLASLPPDQPVHLASWTPMHFAAAAGHQAVVAALLTERADPLVKDIHGRTPLHWAAAGGHGSVVETLLEHDAAERGAESEDGLASIKDTHGCVPLSFTSAELLRFSAGDATQLNGVSIEVGRPAAGVPGEPAVSGVYKEIGKRCDRPCYRRSDGPGWAICWDDQTKRWGLYRERYDAGCIEYQNKTDTPRVPVHGWEPAIAVGPAPTFEEVLPWRGGTRLLAATPKKLRLKPHEVKKMVDSLPDLPHAARVIHVHMGPGGPSITLPPGAPPLEVIIQEMIRRGDLPPEPPPGCLQQ